MTHSQINISNKDHTFNYHVSYEERVGAALNQYYYKKKDDTVFIYEASNDSIIYQDVQDTSVDKWNMNSWVRTETTNDTLSVKDDILYLYFPQFSIETYERDVDYNLMISTSINSTKVILGSFVINRKETIASDKVFTYKSTRYQEYIAVPIVSPVSIHYDNNLANFRETVCNPLGPTTIISDNVNDESVILLVELTPIEYKDGCWSHKNGYNGGATNMIVLDSSIQSFQVSLNLEFGPNQKVTIKKTWNSNYSSLADYLEETYGITGIDGEEFELVMKDGTRIYKLFRGSIQPANLNTPFDFVVDNQYYDIDGNLIPFRFSWDDYIDGCFLKGKYVLKKSNTDVFTLYTREIPLTLDKFKFLVRTNDSLPYYVNLGNISNMTIHQIDVVNKVEQNVIVVNRPDDYKANILKPTFIRTYTLSDIVVHPHVVENICINLNSYKSKVDTFYLRIEDTDFVEVGRTSAGVIFKIVGNNLPNKVDSGTFYILNEHRELVTTGNFSYVQ